MMGFMALIGVLVPWALIPAAGVLIWRMRARRWRAGVATVALVLVMLTQAREMLYAVGLGLPYPYEDPAPLIGAFRDLTQLTEWYTWQILGLAALAMAVLAFPPPEGQGKPVLAMVVVGGLGFLALLVWAFTGMSFI